MAFNWDTLISSAILVWLFLTIAARITKQSIPDLLEGLKEFATGVGEDTIDGGLDLAYYD